MSVTASLQRNYFRNGKQKRGSIHFQNPPKFVKGFLVASTTSYYIFCFDILCVSLDVFKENR